jgi:hypothetical protein
MLESSILLSQRLYGHCHNIMRACILCESAWRSFSYRRSTEQLSRIEAIVALVSASKQLFASGGRARRVICQPPAKKRSSHFEGNKQSSMSTSGVLQTLCEELLASEIPYKNLWTNLAWVVLVKILSKDIVSALDDPHRVAKGILLAARSLLPYPTSSNDAIFLGPSPTVETTASGFLQVAFGTDDRSAVLQHLLQFTKQDKVEK